MSVMPAVDFGKAADDYGRHRAGFPPAFVKRLTPLGLGLSGQRILDLGTGTGTLARQFAQAGCRVSALDVSEQMLAQAKIKDAEAGVTIDYRVGKAEDPPFDSGEFDMIVAGQCWHWFDRARAADAALRMLNPGGGLVIAHFDWIPLDQNVVALTESLIKKHNPAWRFAGGTGMYPAWLADMARAGFVERETFSFDLDVAYSQEAWRGRIRASAGIGASLSPDLVTAFDDEHATLLRNKYAGAILQVPHRVWAVVARKMQG